MALAPHYFTRIRDDASLSVVGEAYRQEMVAKARPPGPDELPPGVPPPPEGYYKALLLPQPENPHDPNAVMVLLWTGQGWALSGYLSRDDALDYQPLLRHLQATGDESPPGIVCDAALTAERDGTGVVVHLGTPGECVVELVTDGRTANRHRWVGGAIVFTGDMSTTIRGVAIDGHAQVMVARWAGCEVMPRLTKKTSALVVSDPNLITTNLQRARDYGVEIVQEPNFLVAVGIAQEAVGRVAGRWARG